MTHYDADVVIVGAGPAGIAAARTIRRLAPAASVVVLEARDRVGGRTWTSTKLGVPVDLGASWIHHHSHKNPLAQHAQRVVHGDYEAFLRTPTLSIENDMTLEFDKPAPPFPAVVAHPTSTDAGAAGTDDRGVVNTPRLPTAIFCGFVDAVDEHGNAVPLHEPARGLGNGHGKFVLFDAEGARVPLATYRNAVDAYNKVMDESQRVADAMLKQAPPMPDGWDRFRSYSCDDLTSLFARHRSFSLAHDQNVLRVIQPLLPDECRATSVSQVYRSHGAQDANDDLNAPASSSSSSSSAFVNTMGFLLSGGEQYEAARLESMSAMYWQSGSSGSDEVECDMFVNYGYGTLVQKLAAELPVRLEHVVEQISYGGSGSATQGEDDAVRVVARHGNSRVTLTAKHCIVAAPLGVLKKKCIEFIPELPKAKLQAIADMGTGVMNKIVLQFAEPFWGDDVISIGYGDRERGVFRWFLSLKPALTKSGSFSSSNTNVLVCFVTCEHAKELEQLSDAEQVNAAMQALRVAFEEHSRRVQQTGQKIVPSNGTTVVAAEGENTSSSSQPTDLSDTTLGTHNDLLWSGTLPRWPLPLVPDPIDFQVTRWWSDPYAYGSYSHFAVGASPLTVLMLGAHVGKNGRVGFAGEHTCLSSIGCVDSAWETGMREGRRVASALKAQVLEEHDHEQ